MQRDESVSVSNLDKALQAHLDRDVKKFYYTASKVSNSGSKFEYWFLGTSANSHIPQNFIPKTTARSGKTSDFVCETRTEP